MQSRNPKNPKSSGESDACVRAVFRGVKSVSTWSYQVPRVRVCNAGIRCIKFPINLTLVMNCSADGARTENCSPGLFWKRLVCALGGGGGERKPLTAEGWRQIQASSPSKITKVENSPSTPVSSNHSAVITPVLLPVACHYCSHLLS